MSWTPNNSALRLHMFHKKTVLVKKRHFYIKTQFFTNWTAVKILLFYKNIFVKNCFFTKIKLQKTAFLQKYFFVKKLLFYVKILLFYKLSGCKETAFLQKYIFVKSCFFMQKSCFFANWTVVKKLLFDRNIFFYYIDTSVLLENIPLVKFIKTTSQWFIFHNLTREFIDDVISVISLYYFIDVFLST